MRKDPATRRVARSILVNADPERALRAFLDPEQMKRWWGAARGLVEERKGGVWALAWGGEEGKGYRTAVSGVLKSFHPGKRILLEPLVYFNPERSVLGPMRLSISVRNQGGRTRVTVRQDGFREGPDWDWYYEAVNHGWKESLLHLKEFLEGPRPDDDGRSTSLGTSPPASARSVT
ncbi:MAG: SRPBCC domain-containing protein [Terriglobia bacterium]